MYGLPKTAFWLMNCLKKRLNKRGYHQSKLVPGMWDRTWHPVQFTLVVDAFEVKYVGEEHTKHIKETLEKYYKVTTEWDGKRYIGITLDWDYKRGQVNRPMSGYIKKALKQFQHKLHKHQQQLFATVPIKYGTKKQYATQESKAPLLDEKGKKFIQHVCGDSFSLVEQ